MTHFHLMSTQKHKILSIVFLNMAKYTILSLILIHFLPIFFIFKLFQIIFGVIPLQINPKFKNVQRCIFFQRTNADVHVPELVQFDGFGLYKLVHRHFFSFVDCKSSIHNNSNTTKASIYRYLIKGAPVVDLLNAALEN